MSDPWSEVIKRVLATHERITVTRDGEPVAVVLATSDVSTLAGRPWS